jgi:hypothetical protein
MQLPIRLSLQRLGSFPNMLSMLRLVELAIAVVLLGTADSASSSLPSPHTLTLFDVEAAWFQHPAFWTQRLISLKGIIMNATLTATFSRESANNATDYKP